MIGLSDLAARGCTSPDPACRSSPVLIGRPVDALTIPRRPAPRGPLTYACDASGIVGENRGYRHRHSRSLSPFGHLSAPEAPFLDRHYPASSVLRASPPPCRPGLPLTGFRLVRAHHRQGFPCCYRPPLPCVPPPLPRRSRSVLASLASRPVAAFPVTAVKRHPVLRDKATSRFTDSDATRGAVGRQRRAGVAQLELTADGARIFPLPCVPGDGIAVWPVQEGCAIVGQGFRASSRSRSR